MNLLGEAKVVLCNEKHSAQTTVLVAADLNHAALIGWQDLQRLHVIPASFPAVAAAAQCFVNIRTKTLQSFPSVFSDSLDNKPMCAQEMCTVLPMSAIQIIGNTSCLLYTSPSPRDRQKSRMPSSA